MSLRDLLPGSVDSGSGMSGGPRSSLRSRFFAALSGAERELWIVAIGAMIADVALTAHGLALGLEEMNPIARQAIDRAGIPGLYGLKGVALLVGAFGRLLIPARATGLVPLALGIPSLCAVGINAALIAAVSL